MIRWSTVCISENWIHILHEFFKWKLSRLKYIIKLKTFKCIFQPRWNFRLKLMNCEVLHWVRLVSGKCSWNTHKFSRNTHEQVCSFNTRECLRNIHYTSVQGTLTTRVFREHSRVFKEHSLRECTVHGTLVSVHGTLTCTRVHATLVSIRSILIWVLTSASS